MKNLLIISLFLTFSLLTLNSQDTSSLISIDSVPDTITESTPLIKILPDNGNVQNIINEGNIINPSLSSGFTFLNLLRGILGMFVVLFIAWIFSTNRRAIAWRTVIIGLSTQLVLAVGILYVPFIRQSFEFVGKIFVKILDFTTEGSAFLFGDLIDPNKFGSIFAFQILPTIIFFSALTSLLFYLGIIQKFVYGLAWLMTKTMKLSGAESL